MQNMALKERLRLAARVLASLPHLAHERPQHFRSHWPAFADMRKQQVVSAGRQQQKFRPKPKEIDDMYFILDRLMSLPQFDPNLIWAWASGIPWALLQARYRLSRTHLNRRYQLALKAYELVLMDRGKNIA